MNRLDVGSILGTPGVHITTAGSILPSFFVCVSQHITQKLIIILSPNHVCSCVMVRTIDRIHFGIAGVPEIQAIREKA